MGPSLLKFSLQQHYLLSPHFDDSTRRKGMEIRRLGDLITVDPGAKPDREGARVQLDRPSPLGVRDPAASGNVLIAPTKSPALSRPTYI